MERGPDNVTRAEASQAHGYKSTSPDTRQSHCAIVQGKSLSHMTVTQEGVPHQKTQAACKPLPAHSCKDFEAAGSWPPAA